MINYAQTICPFMSTPDKKVECIPTCALCAYVDENDYGCALMEIAKVICANTEED